MVAFWKDVAIKASHHSRMSWLKYYRRHKRELHRAEDEDPLPQPPEKKMRYSKNDDFLLAQLFVGKPEGTLDSIFQTFSLQVYFWLYADIVHDHGKLLLIKDFVQHPHHPWKGWQEHYRIHKARIEHIMQEILDGVYADVDTNVDTDVDPNGTGVFGSA
jgi:hypothetical protein